MTHHQRIAGAAASKGQDGNPGALAQTSTAGSPGKATNKTLKSPDLLAKQLTPLLAAVQSRKCWINHLNRDPNTSSDYSWLLNLLTPQVKRCNNTSYLVDLNSPSNDQVPHSKFERLRRKTKTQIRRFLLGLDAYGNAKRFVPMLKYQAYQPFIRRWLGDAESLGNLFNNFEEKQQKQEDSINTAKSAIAQIDTAIPKLRMSIIENEKHCTELKDTIEKQLILIQDVGGKLMRASDQFTKAVENLGGCKIKDILKGAASIVAIVKGGVTAAKNLGPLIDAIESDDEDFSDHYELISQKWKPVKEGTSKISKAFKKLRPILDQGDHEFIPSDKAKILANKDDVVAEVNKYISLDEAKNYVDVINEYVELVGKRNDLIVEHDAIKLQIAAAENQIEEWKEDKDDIQDSIARSKDVSLPLLHNFLRSSLDVYKSELIKTIHYARRALEYLTLEDINIQYHRVSVSQIKEMQFLLELQSREASESKGAEHYVKKIGDVQEFSLEKLTSKADMDKLRNGGLITFSIPTRNYADFCHVYATRLKLDLIGESNQRIFNGALVRVTHSGLATLFDENGTPKDFVHSNRRIPIYANEADGSPLGQGDDFISLTPFGPWEIDLNAILNKKKNFDFSKLIDVKLSFQIRYLLRHF